MSKVNYSALFCIKFDFGLPLEDIFPPNDIHPRLRNLLHQTHLAIFNSPITLLHIFDDFQGSVKERLSLKNDLIKGKLRYRINLNPGGFVWLIRHFLGLLPLPLFPKYTDGEEYKWDLLAVQCKLYGLKQNYQLDSDIFWCINRLPKANITLIFYLMNFFRRISAKYVSSDKLDRKKVVCVVKYFCSSLFVRPYIPGFIFAKDKFYYPLLYYLIQNWPRIKRQKYFLQLNDEYLKLSSIPENNELKYFETKISHNELLECGCQTSSWLLTGNIEVLKDPKKTTASISTPSSQTDENNKECGIGLEEDLELNYSLQQFQENYRLDSGSASAISDNSEKPEKFEKADTRDENIETISEHIYDQIVDVKCNIFNSNSETVIYKKDAEYYKNIIPRNFIKKKILKVNKSLVSVISKFNEKLKTREESNSKLRNHKYDLLQDSNLTKGYSPKISSFTKVSSHIKYKKLMTI